MNGWRYLILVAAAAGTLGLASCSSAAPEPKKTAAEFDFAKMAAGGDPIEPFNRVLSGGEHLFLRWVFRPVGYAYGSVVPRPVIKGFNYFTKNVGFPVAMFSSFLQGEFADGGIVFARFMTNTLMTAGFWDPAAYWFGMRPVNEDFGQAFARWGIGRGFYVGIPSMSGNNARDTVGMVFDFAFDPKTYIYGGQYFTFLNSTMTRYDSYDAATMGNWDDYILFRDIGSFHRDIQVRNWDRPEILYKAGLKYYGKQFMPPVQGGTSRPAEVESRMEPMPDYGSQGAPTDTLRVAMCRVQLQEKSFWPRLSLWNYTDLVHKFKDHSVEVLPGRRKLSYRFLPVEGEKRAPLVVLMPGLGGNALNSMSESIAEMLWTNGYSVVLISNPFSWEFVDAAGTGKAPGYAPRDVADLLTALKKVLGDIRARYQIQPVNQTLAGYSLGGYYALFAAEQESGSLMFDRYLAINPPVNLVNGLGKLDDFYDTWRKWGGKEAYERGLMAAANYLALLDTPHEWQGYSPIAPLRNNYLVPVHNDEAKMLIGYSFKRTLDEVMGVMKKREGSPDYRWSSRGEMYDKLNRLNFRYYAEKVMVPEVNRLTGKTGSLETLAQETSLHALEKSLKENPKMRIIHSTDDFLENDTERKWLVDTLGERIVFMEYGGHLGNLYTRAMHNQILKMLEPDPDAYANLPYVAAP